MASIVAKISNEGVHFSDEIVLPWAATNFPAGSFAFTGRAELFWELDMQSFVANQLNVVVATFEGNPRHYQSDREAKRAVLRLHFAPMPEEQLLDQLAYYKRGELAHLLLPAAKEATEGHEWDAPDFSDFLAAEEPGSNENDRITGRMVDRPVSFSVRFTELTVKNGGVSGELAIPEAIEPVPFTIANDHLIAEFDVIKPFFVSRLKRKTVEVTARLRNSASGTWAITEAKSPQIDRIDGSMIEVFRTRTLRELMNGERLRTIDKQLFTPDDIFQSLEEPALGRAALPNEALDLLHAILASQNVRNAKHLSFLAGELHGAGEKLRFVLSPKFGFVFRVAGREATHYILELLNDHATYVWSIPVGWGSLTDEYAAVGSELSKIAALGRNQYRRLLSFEHPFWLVVHESAAGGVVDGFPRWRNRLLEGLG